MTFVILGCALPAYKIWWPFFVVLFYILAPLPTLLARRCGSIPHFDNSSSNPCLELAIFITMGFVVSSFALPIVLARSPENNPVIQWGACYLTLAGNVIVYLTLVGFFLTFDHDDSEYGIWWLSFVSYLLMICRVICERERAARCVSTESYALIIRHSKSLLWTVFIWVRGVSFIIWAIPATTTLSSITNGITTY